jgi:hypothetical protein
MGAVLLLSEKTQLHRRVPLEKSPEVLQEKARNVVLKFGYQDPPIDSTYGLATDLSVLRYAESRNPALLNELQSSQPASIYFWYRQSPLYLLPYGRDAGARHSRRSTPDLPGNDVSRSGSERQIDRIPGRATPQR